MNISRRGCVFCLLGSDRDARTEIRYRRLLSILSIAVCFLHAISIFVMMYGE